MVEENEKHDVILLLKSGIGVGGISVAGYLLGFSYEKGYTSYFGIPVELIKLNLTTIFLSIIGLIWLLWWIYCIASFGYKILIAGRSGVIRRAIVRSVPFVLLYFYFLIIFANTSTWHSLKWISIATALMSIVNEFVLPLITQRGKGTYYQKLEAQEEDRKKENEPNIVLDVFVHKGNILTIRLLLNIMIILFFLYFSAYWIGEAKAQKQKYFLVTREPKNLVVLRIYGDKFVCAPFDSTTKVVEKTLYLLDTPKQDGIWLDWQQIGPLKPVSKNNKE